MKVDDDFGVRSFRGLVKLTANIPNFSLKIQDKVNEKARKKRL